MAPRHQTEDAVRATAGGGKARRAERRVLVVGSAGLAFLVGVVVGLMAGRGGPVASVPQRTASAVQVEAATGGQYLLSPPNEHDPYNEAGAVPVRRGVVGTASTCPYILCPPNECDPGGMASPPIRPHTGSGARAAFSTNRFSPKAPSSRLVHFRPQTKTVPV
jgi:hypothetical protein